MYAIRSYYVFGEGRGTGFVAAGGGAIEGADAEGVDAGIAVPVGIAAWPVAAVGLGAVVDPAVGAGADAVSGSVAGVVVVVVVVVVTPLVGSEGLV